MLAPQTTERKERGQAIAKLTDQIHRFDDCHYVVKSQSHESSYNVNKETGAWICNCPDHFYRHVKCKHIYAVEFSNELRLKVEAKKIVPLGNLSNMYSLWLKQHRKERTYAKTNAVTYRNSTALTATNGSLST